MTDAALTREHVNLMVLSPEQVIFEGAVAWVELMLLDGSIGIWPGHAPLLGAIGSGTVRFEAKDGLREVPIEGGILRVSVENCIILVGVPAHQGAVGLPDRDELADDLALALEEVLPEEQIEVLQRGAGE